MSETTLSPILEEWILHSVGPGATIRYARLQSGATSSTVSRIGIQFKTNELPFILRQFTNQEWLLEDPRVAEHEAAALQLAATSGLPVPELVAVDPDGTQVGIPALLMTCLPGKVELQPDDTQGWLHQMAEVLPRLHQVSGENFPWAYAPYNRLSELQVPAWSASPAIWERAIEIVNSPPPVTQHCFIHRDYHPTNVLFQDGRLSGIIDWPNACRGPAEIDVAWCRMNLAYLYGVEIADRFLEIYQAIVDRWDYNPFWDLMVIIEALPGPLRVYLPWIEFGMPGLTDELMLARGEAYLTNVLGKLESMNHKSNHPGKNLS